MTPRNNKSTLLPVFTLATSLGTLLCCALPALMVTVGAGAALAGLVSAVPQLVWLSQHKIWVFGFAGAMFVVAGMMRWRARNAPCPIDPEQAKACTRLRHISAWLYLASVGVYLTSAFFAFLA